MSNLFEYLQKTNLPLQDEIDYQTVKYNSPFERDSGYDYDLRGFYKKYNTLTPESTNGHLTDEFKTIIHPTFSIESRYYNNQPYAVNWNSNRQPYKRLSEMGIL
jgi:hypothetical protein